MGLFANNIVILLTLNKSLLMVIFSSFEEVKIDGYFTSVEQVRGGYFVQVKTDG